MPRTQEHIERAERSMREGDSASAARELRAAAETAPREASDADGLRQMSRAVQEASRDLSQQADSSPQPASGGAIGKSGAGSGQATPTTQPLKGITGPDRGGTAPLSSVPQRIAGYEPGSSTGVDRLGGSGGSGARSPDRLAGADSGRIPAAGSTVPYGREATTARQAPEAANVRQVIPPSYRRAVEDYFRSLPPSK